MNLADLTETGFGNLTDKVIAYNEQEPENSLVPRSTYISRNEDSHSRSGDRLRNENPGNKKDNRSLDESEDDDRNLKHFDCEYNTGRENHAPVSHSLLSGGTSTRDRDCSSSSGHLSLEADLSNTKYGAIDTDMLDWDSLNDKDNPQNWPRWKKLYATYTVALICLCVTLGSSLYVSGVPELVKAFKVSQVLCISGLTFYMLGLAFGPAVAAPLSEIIGRRWIYVFSLPISMLFTMGIGLSQNIHSILILRFFCGLIASPALAVAGGSISDVYNPSEIGTAMATFCLAPFLGPVLGPMIGGFAAENKGWRWTMWVSLIISGAVLPLSMLLPETYKPIILIRRAEKRGIKLNKQPIDKQYFKHAAKTALLRPIEMLVVEPIVSVFSIYVSFIFAVLFGFFEAYPVIFQGVYHMGLGVSGLPFIGCGVGLLMGVAFFIVIDKNVYNPKNQDGTRGKRDENGKLILSAPETKLLSAKIGALCLPISLFWLGWTGRTSSVHWMAPTAAGVPFGFGMITIFISVIFYFSMAFPPISVASAIAANNLLRYIMASVFPLFVTQMYHRLNIGWASSLFAFVALLMVPVPFLFEKYGARLRTQSKYGYAAHSIKLSPKNPLSQSNEEKKESTDSYGYDTAYPA